MNEIFDLLLNAEKANKLIENLAGYVVYIYPGIITIYLYNFFNAKITKLCNQPGCQTEPVMTGRLQP